MPITQTQIKKNCIWSILVCGIVAYLIIMFSIFNISIVTILKFILLNMVSIFLPGIAILSLTKIKLTPIGQFCTSYAFGYAFIVLEYFVSEIFNRAISFTAITILVAMISVGIIVRQIKRNNTVFKNKNSDSEIVAIVFLVIFLVLNILAYAANYLGTNVVPVFDAWRDMQYWTNNTVALKLSWPADNLFMSGNALNYHYFSSIPLAFLCEVFIIDVFTMSFPLYTMTKAIIMVGAVQFLLDSVKANRKTSILGYILILCTTGVESVSIVTYVHHTLLSPFGFDIGYAYGILFIALLIRQWNEDRFKGRLFAVTVLVWVMCVGAKAPVASVLILFAALTCLYWLIKKRWGLAFGYGLAILASYLIICKYCVGMFSVVSGDSNWQLTGLYSINELMTFQNPESWAIIAKMLRVIGGLNPVFAVIVRFIYLNPVMVLGAVASIIITIVWLNKKKVSGKDVYLQFSLGLTALWGLLLGVMVNVGGHGEMYFSMSALIPMASMILITLVCYNVEKKTINKLAVIGRKCIVVVFAALLVIGVYRFSFTEWAEVGAVRNSISGLKNIYHSRGDYDYSDQIYSGVRNTDVEALSWIRDNAEPDAMIMTDKAIIMDNSGYYLYGIFCERQQYLEGTDMLALTGEEVQNEIAYRKKITGAVYNNVDGAILSAKNEGVNYIVQTVDITPEFIYNENLLELVESTNTMNIYKLK